MSFGAAILHYDSTLHGASPRCSSKYDGVERVEGVRHAGIYFESAQKEGTELCRAITRLFERDWWRASVREAAGCGVVLKGQLLWVQPQAGREFSNWNLTPLVLILPNFGILCSLFHRLEWRCTAGSLRGSPQTSVCDQRATEHCFTTTSDCKWNMSELWELVIMKTKITGMINRSSYHKCIYLMWLQLKGNTDHMSMLHLRHKDLFQAVRAHWASLCSTTKPHSFCILITRILNEA